VIQSSYRHPPRSNPVRHSSTRPNPPLLKNGPYNPNRKSSEVPDARPETTERLYVSQTVEDVIERVSSKIQDDTLRQIFANCLPSTLGNVQHSGRLRPTESTFESNNF